MSHDPIFASFLEKQQSDGAALAAESDLLELVPLGAPPVSRYIARFTCRGLIRRAEQVVVAECFDVGIHFPSDYLRRIDAAQVLTWLSPAQVWHPNIAFPFICPGRLTPSTSLVEIIHQCFEIITWNKVQMREDDCLNPAACAWARGNRERFPVDTRPLKRRVPAVTFAEVGDRGGAS